MASPNPQQLLGYVIGALDDAQRRRVEDAVSASPALQREVAALADQAGPLLAARRSVDPPRGLAARTCRAVALAAQVAGTAPVAPAVACPAASAGRPAAHAMPSVYAPPSGISRWRWPDLIVTACILACSALLVIPAVYRANLQAHSFDSPRSNDPVTRLANEQSWYERYRGQPGKPAPSESQFLPGATPKLTASYPAGSRLLFPESVFCSPDGSDLILTIGPPSGPDGRPARSTPGR
jgi:hypothetical protein